MEKRTGARALQRVLYIEDDEDIQAIVKAALEEIGGLTLQVCSSGHEALRLVPQCCPDLVLLDVMMPGMDCPAALGSLRELPGCRNLPAVFITARTRPSELAQIDGLSVLGVIVKPFQVGRLAAHLGEMWDARGDGAAQ